MSTILNNLQMIMLEKMWFFWALSAEWVSANRERRRIRRSSQFCHVWCGKIVLTAL
jgi:hypothetical protein